MVRLADQSAVDQLSHAFPGLFRQNVTGMTMATHNLSRSGYFKSFRSTSGCLLHYKYFSRITTGPRLATKGFN